MKLVGKTVLVVEDSWHVAKALKAVLEDTGLVVLGPASSIAGAEGLLTGSVPDLAVVDINLKGESSYALIDRLQHMDVPVVVVTGYAQLAAPLKDVVMLQKPFSAAALVSKLGSIVSRSGQSCH